MSRILGFTIMSSWHRNTLLIGVPFLEEYDFPQKEPVMQSFDVFFVASEQAVQQSVQIPVIGNAITPM